MLRCAIPAVRDGTKRIALLSEVERHEPARLAPASVQEVRIRARAHLLIVDCRHVVTGFAKERGTATAEVFVELQFHRLDASGTSK